MDDEQDSQYPSQINRFHLNKVFDLNKKRKLQAEQLILPISKHRCWDNRLIIRPISIFDEDQHGDDLITPIIPENSETKTSELEVSDIESVKDSNSFVADSDSAMSFHNESNFETEVSNLSDIQCSFDPLDGSARIGSHHHYSESHQNHDELCTEFGCHSDYLCSEHGICGHSFEKPYSDKLFEEILHKDDVNQNVYILSSGRWDVGQDVQQSGRAPTIDEEFEQYFSTLML